MDLPTAVPTLAAPLAGVEVAGTTVGTHPPGLVGPLGATLSTGSIEVAIGAETAPIGSLLQLVELNFDAVPPLPAGLTMANERFSLALTDAQSGGALHELVRPATLTYTPTVDDLAGAGGDLARLRPGIWTGTAWAPLSCAGSLKCTVAHLSMFSVLIVPAGEAGVPDHDLPDGHFFTQAGGSAGQAASGTP